jgi:hypothetical protein
MPTSYRALCDDFYINQRVNLKMDLPMRRDTVLAMFDRVRREHPWMDRFRRYQNELALECSTHQPSQQWLALRKSSVRSGSVNPETPADAYRLHRLVLELAPYFLDIPPLDIDHLELLYGFDLLASGNHDAIVFAALMGNTPLAALADLRGGVPIDCQPLIGVGLDDSCDLQAHFEVKTRTSARQVSTGEFREEPLSVYLTIRKYGPVTEIKDLPGVMSMLMEQGEELLASRVVPNLLVPIREAIASGNV